MAIRLMVQNDSANLRVEEEFSASLNTAEGIPVYPPSYLGSYEVTPGEEQTLETNGYLMEDDVTVHAVPSDYVGSDIPRRTGYSLTTNEDTVIVPRGFYEYSTSKAVASGSASPASSISGTSATISTGTNTITLSKSVSNTPQVSAGYVSSGTTGNSNISLTASVTTKAAATIHPSASDQSISSSTFLTGTQTFKGVTVSNLLAENVKDGVVIKVGDSADDDRILSVTGTFPKPYELVNRLYSADINLSTGTTFDSWEASTTAGSIKATESLSSNTFVADMAHYEYLLWWQVWIQIATTSGATLKAIPIWEGTNSVQSIFRRPNSLATIASGSKAGNACVTQSSAPLLVYYNTSGTKTYTFANTYGLYGTVQAATFSNSTSLTPTVTPKTPVLYARCSSSYFATGRKAEVDSANCTFHLVCDLYRMPIVQYGQTKIYEGLTNTYINSQT